MMINRKGTRGGAKQEIAKGKRHITMKKGIAWILSLVLVFTLGIGTPLQQTEAAGLHTGKLQVTAVKHETRSAGEEASHVDRIAGENRFDTAVQIANEGWPYGASTVVLARGDHFADALAGTPLAYLQDAPILLTDSNRLTPETRAALQQLRPEMVIILGGKGAISTNVEHQLKQMGLTSERIGGANRYETAAQIAEWIGLGEKAIVVSGQDYADALSVSSYAAQEMLPILLTETNRLPEATAAALEDVSEAIVIGGKKAVSEAVYNQLPEARRIAGSNRYATAVEVITQLGMSTVEVFLATGSGYADALTGSVLAARHGAPIVLVEKNRLPEPVTQWMDSRGIHYGTVLGGQKAVSSKVSTTFNESINQVVTFSDSMLEEMIRYALNKPKAPLTRSDLAALQELMIFGEVNDLSGLEYASNVMFMEFAFSNITDISALAPMTQLRQLILWGNRIEDLSPLSNMTHLTILDVDENRIRDLSPLSGLEQLSILFANGNQITDVSPLAELEQLEMLFVAGNQIEDLSPLNSLEQLMLLDASENQIRTIPKLELPGLIGLGLAANQITDISGLSHYEQLMELYLDYNRITDISALSEMKNLMALSLGSNQIRSIAPLRDLDQLMLLNLGYNRITDLSPLSGLNQVVELAINNNELQDISALAEMNQLALLDVSGNQISQVAPLAQLRNMQLLVLDDNDITSLDPLSSMTGLFGLTASLNQISDISALENMRGMMLLDLHDNQIESLDALRGLSSLMLLDVSKNKIDDFSALKGKMIMMLSLTQNELTDLSPLTEIEGLEIVLAANNDIEDMKPLYDYVTEGGFIMQADLRGNRLDLSPESEQLQYAQMLEAMGIELYYLPQKQQRGQGEGQSFDEAALRAKLTEEQREELRSQIRDSYHSKVGLLEKMRDKQNRPDIK